MALKKIINLSGSAFIDTEFGRVITGQTNVQFSAYIKVTTVTGNKTEAMATVEFRDDVNSLTKQYNIPVSVLENAKNFIAQAYEHLKTLPDFAGAIDC